ncbi:MAG: sugar transferase [Eubacteriales bacterium]
MYKKLKRVLDFMIALIALAVLSPLFLILTIAIKIDSPGPVLFRQRRVGMGGEHFYILKFRTMRIDTPNEIPTHLLEDPEKFITRVGRLLRKTSLDEIPQIFNIIGGQMSVVGPRPVLWNEFDLIEERNKNGVFNVRPGLTGLAQISGRDELCNNTKAKVDELYAKNISPILDLACIFKTVGKVLRHDGVVEGGKGSI